MKFKSTQSFIIRNLFELRVDPYFLDSSWAELDETLLLKIGYVILETVLISSFIFILI